MTTRTGAAPRQSARVRAALFLTVVGMLIATLNLVADGAGASWAWSAASVEEMPRNWFLDYLAVRTLAGIGLLTATLWLTIDAVLARRDGSGRDSGPARVRLAVLLFACAPLGIGALLPSAVLFYVIRMSIWEVGQPPGWVSVAMMVSLASSLALALLGLICGALLVPGSRRATARPAAPRSDAAPVTGRPPGVLTAGLGIVGLGLVFAVLDLFVNAIGGYAVGRELPLYYETAPSDPISITLVSLFVLRGLIAVSLVAGTVVLLRRAQHGSDSGRAGLAVLMFCCVPITILGNLYTFALLHFSSAVDFGTMGLSGWGRPALYTSLATEGLLFAMAVLAGSLLALPASQRFTAGQAHAEA